MMRFEFKQQLEDFNTAAKNEAEEDELAELFSDFARSEENSKGTQERIFELQQQKQLIMKELRAGLDCIRNPDCRPEWRADRRTAMFDPNTRTLHYLDDVNEPQTCQFSDILADLDWGIVYNLDPDTVPADLQKKYLLELARQEIRRLLDLQIATSEADRFPNDPKKRMGYEALGETLEKSAEELPLGFKAEIMVRNFLQKLQQEHDLPFELVPADAYQDVEQKMDFVLHVKADALGVAVESQEEAQDIGIQLTTNPEKIAHKERQIERSSNIMRYQGGDITKIALVVLSNNLTRNLVREWEEAGRPAGGPDQFMKKHNARQLFMELCGKILPKETVDQLWQEMGR